MEKPTRADLEEAALAYFAEYALQQEVGPRGFGPERVEERAGYEVTLAREGIRQLDAELVANEFSGSAYMAAEKMLRSMGLSLGALSQDTRTLALQLGARAERELAELWIHHLTSPAGTYSPQDGLFGGEAFQRTVVTTVARRLSRTTIPAAAEIYQARMKDRKLGASSVTETARVLKWLGEVFGPETELGALTPDDLKSFRDGLTTVDKRLQGRDLTFPKRLTGNPEYRISYATAIKYWRSLTQFFRWAIDDKIIATNPADVASLPKPKGVKRNSPAPFEQDELKRLFGTPLYAGHKSSRRVMDTGDCHARGGRWWSGLLFMHTGLRAGELSQLLPSDFDFGGPVPHLKVREEGDAGLKKSVKNQASIRDVPLHPDLIALGLEAFIAARRKRGPSERIFWEFRLGINRKSEGATRFWGDYLKKFGLWKAGRATHVWRHTVVAFLRSNGVAIEDIAAIVGHAGNDPQDPFAFSQTKDYGGGYGLERKLAALNKLDFGFDVVSALGGPYDPAVHR